MQGTGLLRNVTDFRPLLAPCKLGKTREKIVSLQEDGDNETYCDCYEGFGGITCSEELAWWATLEKVRAVVGVAVLALLLAWAIAKVVHSFRFGIWRRAGQLVPVATYIMIAGMLARAVSLPLQPRVHGAEALRQTQFEGSTYRTMSLAYGLIHGTAVAIVACCLNLVLGFWVDVTTLDLRTTVTRRTKVLGIVLAVAIAIVSAASLIAVFFISDAAVAQVPILISTLLDTAIVTAVIGYLVSPCGVGEALVSSASTERKNSTRLLWHYMRRCLLASLAFWYLYVVTAALIDPISTQVGLASFRVILSYITLTGEIGFYTTQLFIIDRHGGPWPLLRDLVRGTRTRGSSESTRAASVAAVSTGTAANPTRSTTRTRSSHSVFFNDLAPSADSESTTLEEESKSVNS